MTVALGFRLSATREYKFRRGPHFGLENFLALVVAFVNQVFCGSWLDRMMVRGDIFARMFFLKEFEQV